MIIFQNVRQFDVEDSAPGIFVSLNNLERAVNDRPQVNEGDKKTCIEDDLRPF
jgi:hypothetical protein